MESDVLEARWRALIEEVVTGMRDWRTAHPRPSFREIEAAVNERLDRIRARMLEEAALASHASDLGELPQAERPCCPTCGPASGGLAARGRRERTITVQGDQQVRLRRSYGVCRSCGSGFFPPG